MSTPRLVLFRDPGQGPVLDPNATQGATLLHASYVPADGRIDVAVSRIAKGTGGGAKSPPVNELSVKVAVTPSATGAIVDALPSTTVRRFMDVSASDLKRLANAADDFLPKIAEAFAKVK